MNTYGPYKGVVDQVHDGDTVYVKLDVGFDLTVYARCRIYGINAPELTTDAGKASRDFARGLLPMGVRYLNPHQTRHTYGHWLRDRGLDLEERQKSMGHESSATTERYYGRVTDLDVARKVAAL